MTEQAQVRGPNIRDVSKYAGVSATTVSRVLNNSTIPSAETRQRVLDAVDKLGYRVDSLFSQAVKRDRQGLRGAPAASSVIGYLANLRYFSGATRSDGYYSAVATGIESVVRRHRHHLMLEGLEWGQREIPECVTAGRVDGILVEGTIDPTLRALLVSRLPTVFIDRVYPELACSCVFPDYAQSIRCQLEYLWELGHRNVAIFWHDVGDYQQIVSLDAFSHFFQGHGQTIRHPQLCAPRNVSPENEATVFAEYAKELATAADRPTALIGPNAYIVPIFRHLQELGLNIPRDLSVIGTNDQINGEVTNPPLTSWQMSMEEVGRCGVEVLIEELQDPKRHRRRIAIDGRRIERTSCAPPLSTIAP
jgi:DNA-binding LacI/PurR family transcriptional regulator